jgi:hypothetical protein
MGKHTFKRRSALGPGSTEPHQTAYLCLGYVNEFSDRPDLENAGWLPRLEVSKVIYYDQWESNNPSGIGNAI